jgi:hypothetical protein
MQRNRYELNETFIKDHAKAGSLDELAAGIAARVGPGPLRGNGTGDLFPELCELYARLAMHGTKVYLFSRIPEMIRLLGEICHGFRVIQPLWPTVLGSVDPSTTNLQIHELESAIVDYYGMTRYSPHVKARIPNRILAIATAAPDPVLKYKWYDDLIRVIFGYHSNHTKTVVDHPLACPATNGEDIKCLECRRCIDLI